MKVSQFLLSTLPMGQPPSDWNVVSLKEVTSKIGSGATPRGGAKVYRPSGITLIRSQNVHDHQFTLEGLAFIGEIEADKLNNVIVESGDVLLNITGDSIARCCLVPDSFLPARVNQHVAILRPNKKLNSIYLQKYLTLPQVKEYMLGHDAGGTRRALTKGNIESFLIPLPPLAEQKAIAHILGTLDDKIELNQRMNKTLEAIARAIFKSWFIDFDPVRAKMEGRQPEGMSKEVADLFCDSFVDSELGMIPKGWEVKELGKLAENFSKTFDFSKQNQVIFINTGDVLAGNFLHNKFVGKDELPGQAKKSISKNDILLSEIRPANQRFAFVNFDVSNYVVSTKFMVIRAFDIMEPRLLYRILTLQSSLTEFQIVAESRSGTFPQITFDSISYFPIIVPPKNIQLSFLSLISPLQQKIQQNYLELSKVTNIRDTLLPKLISGEIRVKEAEKIVEKEV